MNLRLQLWRQRGTISLAVSTVQALCFSLQDPTVSLNTATGLMASLVDTVQFARDRFDVYEQMATEKVQHGEYGLMKKLQTKQTSAHGKRSKPRSI